MASNSLDLPNNMQQSAPVSLSEVRRLFARTHRLQESQFLRREVAARMFERLTLIKTNPFAVLDAGCGEGDDLFALRARFPTAALCGVDAAQAMLEFARGRMSKKRFAWLQQWWSRVSGRSGFGAGDAMLSCADFARLPLRAASQDLVWSNLALHWHPQPDRVFAEWRRVLRVDGLLMFSCFGPNTFKELRDAFALSGQAQAVLPFVDLHDLGDMLVGAGFSTPVMDMEMMSITYTSIEKLMQDVRAFGGNPLTTRRKNLLGKQVWAGIREILEQGRDADGKINLSVELIYGHAFRPISSQTADGSSIIRFDALRK